MDFKKYFQLLGKSFYRPKDQNIYLIYTMGKVGSGSIYRALKKALPFRPIFHTHFLSTTWLEKILPGLPRKFQHNIKTGFEIRNYLEKNRDKRVKVITLVREPVMRSISDLFQNWQHIFEDIEKVKNEQLLQRMAKMEHDYTLSWFETEFSEFLGVDIYELPFDPKKGYGIYHLPKIDLLCMKFEMLNQKGEQAIREFLHLDLKLRPTNVTLKKKGNQGYAFLKSNFKTSPDKLRKLYQSKYVQFFYSEAEIKGFIQQWSKTPNYA